MKSFFESQKPFEKEQARIFSERFQVVLKKLQDVRGQSGDYAVVKGELFPPSTILEFKNDKKSLRTKNLYLESKQTTDGWFTTKKSGVALALQQGQVVVIKSGNENFILRTQTEYQKLLKMSHAEVSNGTGINGNPAGSYTKGDIVKLIHVRPILECYSSLPLRT